MSDTPNYLAEHALVTVEEAGRLLNLTRQRVSQLLHAGDIEGIRIGNGPRARWRIPLAALNGFLAERSNGAIRTGTQVRRDLERAQEAAEAARNDAARAAALYERCYLLFAASCVLRAVKS